MMEFLQSSKDACAFYSLRQNMSGETHTHTQNDLHFGKATHREKNRKDVYPKC